MSKKETVKINFRKEKDTEIITSFEFEDFRDWLSWGLMQITSELRVDPRPEEQAKAKKLEEYLKFIVEYVYKIDIKAVGKKYELNIEYAKGIDNNSIIEQLKAQMQDMLLDKTIQGVIDQVYALFRKKPGGIHKQIRGMQRSIAQIVGKETKQQSLFTLPIEKLNAAIENLRDNDGILKKEKMTQKVGILSQKIIQLWQRTELRDRNDSNYLSIDDIGALAEELQTDTKELKYYFLYLGGFQYPSITYYKDRGEMGVQMANWYEVEFIYDERGREKIINTKTIGNILMLMDLPVRRIKVKPSDRCIRDLTGKDGFGYINVPDDIFQLMLGISSLAYKLLNYSQANVPKYTIDEKKLFDKLGLGEQVKTQGLPRVRARLSEAFAELKDRGHFNEYRLASNGDTSYSWTYSAKWTKHQYFKPKKELPAGEKNKYIDFKDESIPVEIRRKGFTEWLVKEKNTPEKAAKAQAYKRFPIEN